MLDKKYNEVIENLNLNMENPRDSAYARKVITELTMTYLDEVNKLEKAYEKRLQICTAKLVDLEKRIRSIEEEIIDEDDYITISCPYCNTNIVVDFISQEEIECPECHNTIELDWSDLDDDFFDEDDDDDIM
jgi:ribosomal protein S27E